MTLRRCIILYICTCMCFMIFFIVKFPSIKIKRRFLLVIILIMLNPIPLVIVFSMFLVLQCFTYHVNSASPLEHTETPAQESCFSSCAQPPAPKKVYCRRSSSPPPPAKYMYITGVPGELYRTGPGDQWGYYSSANNNINTIKSLLVIVIVGWFGAIINVWEKILLRVLKRELNEICYSYHTITMYVRVIN